MRAEPLATSPERKRDRILIICVLVVFSLGWAAGSDAALVGVGLWLLLDSYSGDSLLGD